MIHRFLHLSDIHFGQEKKDGTLVKQDYVRSAVVKDAEKLANERGAATRVVVTGDIAFSGKGDEYKLAAEWLETLTRACKCDVTAVSTIPGNHDCDLDAISHQAKMLYGQMRANTPEQVQANLHAIHKDGENASPFLPKLKAYREFASGFGCDFESPARPCWVRDFDLAGGVTLRFHGLTSVQVCDKGDELGKMILGNGQYTLAEVDNVVNIVLCHHPIDWFIDKEEASRYLRNNARAVIVGHEHVLNIQKTTDALANRECLMLYAGATTPNDVYTYTYNWLEFSWIEENGQHYLVVEAFPRVWVPDSVRFDADRTRLGGSGDSVKVKILCSNIRPAAPPPAPAGQVAAQGFSSGAAVTPPASSLPPPSASTASSSPQNGSPMQKNTAGFSRLRYLFWRYLDWRQRLKVLVDLDALPKTADQPIPQTMERLALDAASQDIEKLHALWEAIMPLIPEDKREANPFPLKGE